MSPNDPYSSAYSPTTGWVGWIFFAAIMMVVMGTMNAIQGLAAILRDDDFWGDAEAVTFNITAWGWIHLLFGIALVLIGFALMRGSTFARVVGVGLVALNLIAQFSWATVYPFWSMIAIAIDVFIIYALVMHGGELAEDR
jgi:hypothetical protein